MSEYRDYYCVAIDQKHKCVQVRFTKKTSKAQSEPTTELKGYYSPRTCLASYHLFNKWHRSSRALIIEGPVFANRTSMALM